MVADNSSSANYGLLLYNEQPVEKQEKLDDEIVVKFYTGETINVSPTDWVNKKRFAYIPRSYGSRKHILNNWAQYSKYCVLSAN
jgi:hypothetical protein